MKIILCGAGRVGEGLADALSAENHDLVIIDTDGEAIENVTNRYDCMALRGNCASMNVLRQAGVADADLLIATTGVDEVNLLCCITSRLINPSVHTIARVSSPEYSEQAYSMGADLGLSLTFNPDGAAAEEIGRLLRFPGFLKRDTFARGMVQIVELKIDEDSRLCNVALYDMNTIIRKKVLVCAVIRDGRATIPSGNFILREGDRIFVTAPTEVLSDLLNALGIVTHRARNVVIVGGSTVGHYLAEYLLSLKVSVSIIERDGDVCEDLAARFPSANIIHGDARSRELLESEKVDNADAIVTVTGHDEVNIIVSLYGKRFGVGQIITKLEELDDSKILSALPVGSLINPIKLSCNTVVRYVRAMTKQSGAALTIHSIADGEAEAIEFPVDSETVNCGIPLKKLRLKDNVLIVSITRSGVIEIPSGDSFYQPGDTVVVVSGNGTVLRELSDIFQ